MSVRVIDCGLVSLGRMGQLLTKCPACGGVYPSGIVTDLEMLERDISSDRNVTTHCPFCGRVNSTSPQTMAFVTATS